MNCQKRKKILFYTTIYINFLKIFSVENLELNFAYYTDFLRNQIIYFQNFQFLVMKSSKKFFIQQLIDVFLIRASDLYFTKYNKNCENSFTDFCCLIKFRLLFSDFVILLFCTFHPQFCISIVLLFVQNSELVSGDVVVTTGIEDGTAQALLTDRKFFHFASVSFCLLITVRKFREMVQGKNDEAGIGFL